MSDFKFFCQLVRLNIGHDFYITGNRCDFFSSFVAMFPEYSRTDSALEMLRMLFGIQFSSGTYEDEKGFTRICYAKLGSHVFVKNNQINSKELRDGLWELAQLEAKEEE